MAGFLLLFVVALAAAEAEQTKAAPGSAAPVTLRTIITGSCQEVQRYAESVLGSGVIRSVTEVRTGMGLFPATGSVFLSL